MSEIGGRIAGTLLVAIQILIACSIPGSPAVSNSLQLSGEDSEGGQFELTVIDPATLVNSGQSLPRPSGLSDKGVKLDADGESVLVWWPGLPCEDRPQITVSGAADVVSVTIDNGPRRTDVCQMNEVQFTIRLRLNREYATAELAM